MAISFAHHHPLRRPRTFHKPRCSYSLNKRMSNKQRNNVEHFKVFDISKTLRESLFLSLIQWNLSLQPESANTVLFNIVNYSLTLRSLRLFEALLPSQFPIMCTFLVSFVLFLLLNHWILLHSELGVCLLFCSVLMCFYCVHISYFICFERAQRFGQLRMF